MQWHAGGIGLERLITGVIVLIQFISATELCIYNISYYNQIMNTMHALENIDVNDFDYSVSLDQATAHPSQKPGARLSQQIKLIEIQNSNRGKYKH